MYATIGKLPSSTITSGLLCSSKVVSYFPIEQPEKNISSNHISSFRVFSLILLLVLTSTNLPCMISSFRIGSLSPIKTIGLQSPSRGLSGQHTLPFFRLFNSSSNKFVKMARTALEESSATGAFVRTDASWRNWISRDKDAKFPAALDRYHLYVSYACPWAHRTLMVRAIKGLEDVISVTVVHPTWQRTKPNDPNDPHTGWIFGNPLENDAGITYTNSAGNGGPFKAAYADNTLDPNDSTGTTKTIRDVYERCHDTDGKYSVPILYDKVLNTIVSNESSEIIRMLNSEFNEFCKTDEQKEIDLYPPNLRSIIDEVNSWIYPTINNGVYRCGFAKSQGAYDIAIKELTESFDKLNSILSKQRYIAGDKLTEADIRLFVTLVRFDEVYVVYFKTNTRSVASTPAILNYMREIYQIPGVASTVNMEHIKLHYYTSHPTLNYYSIIPAGSNFIELLQQPHNRDTI